MSRGLVTVTRQMLAGSLGGGLGRGQSGVEVARQLRAGHDLRRGGYSASSRRSVAVSAICPPRSREVTFADAASSV